jgi:photosystem II stability/assembly factor-like uncharacterized protein
MIALLLPLLVATASSQSILWEQSNGPFGGTVPSLVIDSNDRIWAGTWNGLYHSANSGQNWIFLNNELREWSIGRLVINSNGDLFATVGALFRSSDDGQTWTELNTPSQYIYSLCINSADHLLLSIYPSDSTLATYRSTDNGDNWVRLTDMAFNSFAFDSKDNIFAGGVISSGGGLYSSTDNGDNWIPIDLGVEELLVRALLISSEDHIFVGTRGDWLYRSIDHGGSWIQFTWVEGLRSDIIDMLFSNPKGDIFAVSHDVLLRSRNNGDSWIELKEFDRLK